MMSTSFADPQQVIDLRKANPCMTLEGIGQQVSLTRERIRQILKKAGHPTGRPRLSHICLGCGITYHPKDANQIYHNRQCYREYRQVPVICEQCGLLFRLYQSNLLARLKVNEHIFHSHECAARYGVEHGHRFWERRHAK